MICLEKIAFDTRKNAKEQASRYAKKYGREFRVYRCLQCNFWHVASGSKRERSNRKERK